MQLKSYIILILIHFMLCVGSVAAQDVCIPKVAGVPGMWGSPPDLSSTTWMTEHPNWRGSMAVAHHYGNGNFRALHDVEAGPQKYLYMQWSVDGPTGNSDQIKFAFRHGTTGEAFKFNLDMTNKLGVGSWPAGTTTSEIGIVDRKSWDDGSSTWVAPGGGPTIPPSIDSSARFFVDCPGAPAAQQACASNQRVWTLQFRVRIDDPGDLDFGGDSFYFWYDVSTTLSTPNFIVVTEEYPSPPTTPTAPDDYPTDINALQAMTLSNSGGPGCVGDVTLNAGNINTTNPNPHEMSFTDPTTFVITPTNVTQDSSDLHQQDLEAKVRLANWGSASFDSPDWNTVCTARATSTSAVPHGNNFDLQCIAPAPTNPCTYDPNCDASPDPNLWQHQCILAELTRNTATTGTVTDRNLVINPSSAYQNMDFAATSTFERDAQISVRGLQALAGSTKREVYLLLTTRNMPVIPDYDPKSDPREPGYRVPFDKKMLTHQNMRGGYNVSQLMVKLPHLVVRVFHDTGFKQDGKVMVREQPSFGYFPLHEGAIYGFRQWLSGEGLVQLTDDLYKIVIPNNPGLATVSTYVQSVDQFPDCFAKCQEDRICRQGCECEVECEGDEDAECQRKCLERKSGKVQPKPPKCTCGRCETAGFNSNNYLVLLSVFVLLTWLLMRVVRRRKACG